MKITGEHILSNKRKYRLQDHGKFRGGEYPTGGIHISTWEQRLNKGAGGWRHINNAPNEECAREFLNAAERLIKIKRNE